jgi:hypothetical protein
LAKKRRKEGGALGDFAEDLGKLLGTTERKASAWLGQRKAIAMELTKVRDKANELLRQLTGGAADMAVAVGVARGTRRGRPPGSKSVRKARRRRPFTAAQRKEVSARMKKYWAGRRAKEARRKRTAKKALKA